MNLVLFESHEATGSLFVKDDRAKHIRKILRLQPGDHFRAGIVDQGLYRGTVISYDSSTLSYSLETSSEQETPAYPIHLCCGVPRPNSLRRVVREAAAMGVKSLTFLHTDLGEKSYRDSHLLSPATIRRYLLEGLSQSYSFRLPDINLACTWDELLAQQLPKLRLAFDIGECLPLAFEKMQAIDGSRDALVMIGSERGWSERERNLLLTENFTQVQLGPRILRTDTAFISALSLLTHGMEIARTRAKSSTTLR